MRLKTLFTPDQQRALSQSIEKDGADFSFTDWSAAQQHCAQCCHWWPAAILQQYY